MRYVLIVGALFFAAPAMAQDYHAMRNQFLDTCQRMPGSYFDNCENAPEQHIQGLRDADRQDDNFVQMQIELARQQGEDD